MTKSTANILIVDDDNDILTAGKLLLKRKFSNVSTCNQPSHIPIFFENQKFDVVLLDMNFGPGENSGSQGFYWLQQIKILSPQSVIIMITAHGGIDIAVEAMKLGATDFVSKPWQNEKMLATVTTAVLLAQSQLKTQSLQAQNKGLIQASMQSHSSLIGNGHAMQRLHSLIARSAPTDANILILGENGTGKELVAREIHNQSMRANQVFMSIDLGSISESLFESELFGYQKGAFTGATQDRIGRLLGADGGTLFLDEIGNLPLHLQAKLLTVLEQRNVTPLGANAPLNFNVRILAATNVAMHELRKEQRFRQDLLFRLNTVELTLPPLRDRPEDIAPLTQYYLEHYQKKYNKTSTTLSDCAIQALNSYQWPGNIRELRHVIERAIILTNSSKLIAQDFQLFPAQNHVSSNTLSQPTTPNNLVAQITDEPTLGAEQFNELNLERLEKSTISQALKKHKYNISHSAKALGLTRAALYRRMEKYGI
jgi:DNA-binding NtrC family response regulator